MGFILNMTFMGPEDAKKIGTVILAGGLGTRMRRTYPSIPKPMIEVCGCPFIEWVIRYFLTQGLTDFCISVGYKADTIENYFRGRPANGLRLYCMREETPQGTGGGFLLSATKFQDKDYLLATNGDSLVLADLSAAFEMVRKDHYDAVIIGRRVKDPSRYGSLKCDKSGMLIQFREKEKGKGLINAGVYIFPRSSLTNFPSKKPLSFEYDVFPFFLQKGMKIRVLTVDEPFIDIGTPEAIREAEAFIMKHRVKFT
jgi:D-glycero-alpha-D-manno-heptose 1-phosphate guanylyltransferase